MISTWRLWGCMTKTIMIWHKFWLSKYQVNIQRACSMTHQRSCTTTAYTTSRGTVSIEGQHWKLNHAPEPKMHPRSKFWMTWTTPKFITFTFSYTSTTSLPVKRQKLADTRSTTSMVTWVLTLTITASSPKSLAWKLHLSMTPKKTSWATNTWSCKSTSGKKKLRKTYSSTTLVT